MTIFVAFYHLSTYYTYLYFEFIYWILLWMYFWIDFEVDTGSFYAFYTWTLLSPIIGNVRIYRHEFLSIFCGLCILYTLDTVIL